MERGLVHLNSCSLFHKEHGRVLHLVCIVLYLPCMSQHQHKSRHRQVDLAALVVFKSIVGGIPSITISHLDLHTAVTAVFHKHRGRFRLQLRDTSQVNIPILRYGSMLLHIGDHV